MSDTIVTITADDIAAKQATERRLEKVIADAQQELADVREWLRAMAILRKPSQPAPSTPSLFPQSRASAEPGEATPPAPDPDNLTDAIENIANGSAVAVPKKELKKTLRRQGFPAERLENYFYTAIHRLKNKKRITVMSDGSVWKAPQDGA